MKIPRGSVQTALKPCLLIKGWQQTGFLFHPSIILPSIFCYDPPAEAGVRPSQANVQVWAGNYLIPWRGTADITGNTFQKWKRTKEKKDQAGATKGRTHLGVDLLSSVSPVDCLSLHSEPPLKGLRCCRRINSWLAPLLLLCCCWVCSVIQW